MIPGEDGQVHPGAIRPAPLSGADVGGDIISVSYDFGGMTIIPPAGQDVTPELIVAAIELYEEQNPPQRKLRDRL